MQKNEVLESALAQSITQGESLKEGLAGHAALIHDGLAQFGVSLIIGADSRRRHCRPRPAHAEKGMNPKCT